jgi:hypothetical protein
VSLLKDLEQRFETLLEGFFARQFKSGVQPVEIAKKLSRDMDTHRAISISKVYVPNHYIIRVSPQDADRLKPFERTLLGELQSFLLEHANKEGYDLVERPHLELTGDDKLSLGGIQIESSLTSPSLDITDSNGYNPVEQTIAKAPSHTKQHQVYLIRIDREGEMVLPVNEQRISIGRSADNTIVIDDPNVSRQHALIEKKDGRYILKDIQSTNGTFIGGTKVESHSLHNGDTITIGTTKLQFRR